ncbi:MAG TPA: hypothetical protein ENI87_03935 [bacterium]|nr:hypothetical protein [bacterium]
MTLLLACAGTLNAQQIWKVFSGGGPGVDFTDLPPAVAAAEPGDEIWVYWQNGVPVSVTYYTPAIITRGVRIVGFELGLAGPGSFGASYALFEGLFTIVGLPAGEQVTLSNLEIYQSHYGDPAGIVAVDCAGDIVIESCGSGAHGAPYGTLLTHRVHFERCANVEIHASGFAMGGTPLTVIDSNVRFLQSRVTYRPPYNCNLCWANYPAPTEGLRLVDSSMTMVESTIQGGPKMPSQLWFPAALAQPGAVLVNSSLVLGPHSELLGGSYGGGHVIAYTATSNSTLAIDHRAVVDTPPSGGLPPRTWMSSVVTYVNGGQPYDILVSGEPGGFAVVASGEWAPTPLPTSIGELSLVPGSMVFTGILPLSSPTLTSLGGDAVLTLDCPKTAPVAHPFAMQAMTLSPNGTIRLSEQLVFTVAWPLDRMP